ncbi:MAG: DUF2225 domain-containing protein [Oscillospiraceae bacterium]|jgi:uncharacterized protein (DUF2225 family)|nr:DUF2225 domain-containing protein [Oscillospiraceae bacterium]
MAINSSETISPKKFPMGEVIVKEGSSLSKGMVVVLKGNAGVYKNYKSAVETCVKVIGPGSFHCEQSLFLDSAQTETLVALTQEVLAFIITRENVKEFFRDYTDTALSVAENICRRLSEADAELGKLRKTDSDAPSGKSKLFPEGHGSYTLGLMNSNEQLVYCTKATCPLCGHVFDNLGVFMSRLRQQGTDPDSRVRYKDAEPLYYEITTCPNCLFSVDYHSFADTSVKLADKINQLVGKYKLDTRIQTGRDRDTFAVFAGYYLALLCTPVLFADYQLTAGGLWHKVSRLYADCKDEKMELYAAKQSLENYQYAYTNFNISEKQTQQVCYVIGELNFRLGNLDEAKNYFYMVKTSPSVTELLKRRSDNRIEDVREYAKAHGKE